MNLDFHYYATYLAARYANFAHQQAMVIARSAQLVDDLTLDFLDKYNLREGKSEETVTCMPCSELGSYYVQSVPWTEQQKKKFIEVWMAFHFPPGNESGRVSYQGETKQDDIGWIMQKEEEQAFKLLCLPGSNTIKAYVEELKKRKKETFFLQMLGIRMHILADSWAHSGFLGYPMMCANEVVTDNKIYVEEGGRWRAAILCKIGDDIEKCQFIVGPGYLNSFKQPWAEVCYLGHARVGSMADYGALKFKYSPFYRTKSDQKEIERDNRQMFANAFNQMVYAMECVQKEAEFKPEYIPDTYTSKVLPVLETRKLDQSEQWNKLIAGETIEKAPIPVYNLKDWAGSNRKDYDNHIKAVKLHIDFFRQYFSDSIYSTGEQPF